MAGRAVTAGPAPRERGVASASGDARESAILATAERLMAERPFAEISVDDLARGAGISRPSFYFYFRSKDAVLLTLLDRVVAESDLATAEALARTPEEPREQARLVIETMFRTLRRHRAVAAACAERRLADPEIRRRWALVLESWVDGTQRMIEHERRRGAAPDGIPARTLAIALSSMNERVIGGSLLDDQPAVEPDAVMGVLLHVWLGAIYHDPCAA
jgi:TetR/AcrR family transcriptional regulator, ethionamide resistance regulator